MSQSALALKPTINANFPRFDQFEPIFVELCAGSAVLSAAARRAGFTVFPIDCSRNRHNPAVPVFELDLATDFAWEFLHHVHDTASVVAWHFGLPCGTCSRAREVRLSESEWGPPPLRSRAHLLGVPGLSHHDRLKVDAANALYQRACAFAEHLVGANAVITIENPGNSWLWELPFLSNLLTSCHFVDLHACMYGGTRRKLTTILTNSDAFDQLAQRCDDTHGHEPWGMTPTGFATALEAQYPEQLCEAYVAVMLTLPTSHSLSSTPKPPPSMSEFRPFQQARGRRSRPIIDEFLHVRTVLLSHKPAVTRKDTLVNPVGPIPAGSKLLRTEAKGGKMLCVIGIYRSFQQFVQASRALRHPFDDLFHVPDILLKCLADIMTWGPSKVARHRLETLTEWRKLRSELDGDEKDLQQKVPHHMQGLVKSKRFVMIKALAQKIGWPDTHIHEELVEGFKIVGQGPRSNVFRPDEKAAQISVEELAQKTRFLRPAILGRIRSQEPPEYLDELRAITMKETLEKGWLQGPMSLEEVQEEFGANWLPVTRFAVRQKDKLRPIDNFAENCCNEAWAQPEKLDLHNLDQMVWLLSLMVRWSFGAGRVEVPLKDGSKITGAISAEWTLDSLKCLVTTVDLQDAYKQLGLHASDRSRAVVALKGSEGRDFDLFAMNTLPFGASASVHHFNRFSRMLWAIGVEELKLPWLNYFDDYPMVTPKGLSESSLKSATLMLDLIGVAYSWKKLVEPKDKAEVLGVVVGSDGNQGGEIIVEVKEKRRIQILEELDRILQAGCVIPARLPSTLGRIQFAEGQLAGRLGRLAMADIRELGVHSKATVKLSPEHAVAFECLRDRFTANIPKRFKVSNPDKPVVVFTDGSYEADDPSGPAKVGGVLLDGEMVKAFGALVPDEVLSGWKSAGKVHLIGQVELYGVMVARDLWKAILHGRRVFMFVDNWGVLDSLIPGRSKERTWREMLVKMERIDAEYPSYIWYARVPSSSNVADPPSRGSLDGLGFLGRVMIEVPVCPLSGERLMTCVEG